MATYSRMPSRFAPFTAEVPSSRTNPLANGHATSVEKSPVKGILEIEIHHAKDIHNICIYTKQDVYAKFSLNHDGAETTLCTEVVNQGGKDPVFNQKFRTSVVQSDRVLRCEVWMASKLKDYLQDQLLGLVSVPLSSLVGKGRQYNVYGLSSTELFHSPAGSLSLTLEFHEEAVDTGMKSQTLVNSSNNSEACDDGSCTSDPSACSEGDMLSVIDSKVVEFADLDAAREDQQLVSDFILMASKRQTVEATKDGILTGPPYLKLKCSDADSHSEEEQQKEPLGEQGHVAKQPDSEGHSPGGNEQSPAAKQPDSEGHSPVGNEQTAKQPDSEGHSPVEDEQGRVDADEHSVVEHGTEGASTDLGAQNQKVLKSSLKQLEVVVSTSSSLIESSVTNGITPSSKEKEVCITEEAAKVGVVSKPEFEPEPRIMQEEIVDMYMKSMQQFSDALAKMQLPVDENGIVKLEETSETSNSEQDSGDTGKKSAQRVFYGSRAFF